MGVGGEGLGRKERRCGRQGVPASIPAEWCGCGVHGNAKRVFQTIGKLRAGSACPRCASHQSDFRIGRERGFDPEQMRRRFAQRCQVHNAPGKVQLAGSAVTQDREAFNTCKVGKHIRDLSNRIACRR